MISLKKLVESCKEKIQERREIRSARKKRGILVDRVSERLKIPGYYCVYVTDYYVPNQDAIISSYQDSTGVAPEDILEAYAEESEKYNGEVNRK